MVVSIVLAIGGFAAVAGTLVALRVRSRRTIATLRANELTVTGSIPALTGEV